MAGEELKQSMEKCFSFSCTVEASNKFDELLQVEHDEEVQQGKEVLACHSLRELVARGFCVSNLHLESQRTGLNGRYLLHFVSGTKHGGDSDQRHWLQCSTFKQGDIVSVRMFENPSTCKEDCMDNLTGVVWKLGSSSITISLEENCAESSKLRVANCKSKFSLVKLANDITYRRYKRCMQQLRCSKSSLADTLVQNFSSRDIHQSQVSATLDARHWLNPELDESQRSAVQFCIPHIHGDGENSLPPAHSRYSAPRPVSVVHGPPGTGKTTTVAEIICQYVRLKVKVLLCAPSNVAVDNVLEKLLPYRKEMKMIRLGHPARVAKELQHHTLEHVVYATDESDIIKGIRRDIDTNVTKAHQLSSGAARRKLWAEVKDLRKDLAHREARLLEDIFKRCDVVLSTLTTASQDGPLRHVPKDHFGLVIIDEAAQAIEPACWIPLLNAPACILAGDHLQLPPTIVSPEAAKRGLEVTMMERIVAKQADSAVRMLTTQYRMHDAIMRWSSSHLYGDRLVAHPSVAKRLLSELDGVESHADYTDLPLLLIDTAGCDLQELPTDSDMSKGNTGEADLAAMHVRQLIRLGVKPADIAVISPYNLQVEMMSRRLNEEFSDLGVHSIDGYQGREKEAVVISLVRSNPSGNIGFLSEERRLNVAITRARRHLCLVCDSETVKHNTAIRSLIEYIEDAGCVHSAAIYQNDSSFVTYTDNEVLSSSKFTRRPISSSKSTQRQSSSHKADKTDVPKKVRHHIDNTSNSKPSDSSPLSEASVIERFSQQLTEFSKSDDQELVFPSTLNSFERRVVHQLCTNNHLHHESRGEGNSRHIVVWKSGAATGHVMGSGGESSYSSRSDIAVLPSTSEETACAPVKVHCLVSESDHSDSDSSSGQDVTMDTNKDAVTVSVTSATGISAPAGKSTKQALVPTEPLSVKLPAYTDGQAKPLIGTAAATADVNTSTVSKCERCQRPVPASNLDLHLLRCHKPVSGSATGPVTASATSRKKKQKSKGKTTSISKEMLDCDDLDGMLDEVKRLDNTCAFHTCKKATGLVGGRCDYCHHGFCLSHLQAEVHGCGDTARVAARSSRTASARGNSASRPVGLQRKLQKQIDSRQQQRSAKKKS